jgi:hypothetical protein
MRRRIGYITFLLFLMLAGTACSGSAAGSSPKEQITKKNPETINWEVTSRAYYTKGEITELNQSGGYADAITMKVNANYRSDNDPSDEPPFQTEQVVTFKLLTVVHVAELKLTKGMQVIINSSQFTPKHKETPFWAGDIIGYEENGMYYDLTKKLASFTMSKQAALKDGELVNHYSLFFEMVKSKQHINKVLKLEKQKIIKEQPVKKGKIIIFTNENDEERLLFGAFQTEDAQYELGLVGQNSPALDDESLSVKELTLFNKSLILVSGVLGANAPLYNYFSIEEDGAIHPFLIVDTGHAIESDLDNDGIVEIVSTNGTPSVTYIYKWQDGAFYISNVNEALGAASVDFDIATKRFSAQFNIQAAQNERLEYKSGLLTSKKYHNASLSDKTN